MSNALSVSAATTTLRNLLERAIRESPPGTVVTTRPPDKARDTITGNQLNLFLYHTVVDAAFRNLPIPGPVRDGGGGRPPLPLCLYYLITAYGENDDDTAGHRVLGGAMSALHDHPLLSAEDIRSSQDAATDFDLQNQREGLRITHQPLTLEEMSKLWTTFQTQYRISAAYEVSVVLIDSTLATRSVLPVLRQGPDDTGPDVQGDPTGRLATVEAATVSDPSGAAALGDTVVLTGHHLTGATVVRLRHPLLPGPRDLPVVAGGTDRSVSVLLPLAATATLPSGAYTAEVILPDTVAGAPDERTSNRVVLALGPRITSITPPNPVPRGADGTVTLTVTATPDPQPGQRVRLLLGDREFAPRTPDSLAFVASGLAPGSYLARLRVDGFDSRVVAAGSRPLRFDPTLQVVVT